MPGRIHKLIYPSSNAAPSGSRKLIAYLLKLGITVFILWRISSRIDLTQALTGIFSLPWQVAALVTAISFIRHAAQYYNWHFALQLNPSYIIAKREIMASYLVALPLRFLIPGGSASFGKIFYLSNSSLMASLAATAAERAFMTWATWSFAALASLYYFVNISLGLRMAALMIIIILPAIAYVVIKWRFQDPAFAQAYKMQAPRMMAMQLVASGMAYLQYWLILNAFGVIGLFQCWMRMALTNFSNSIPVTVAGLGLRESFAIHFLADAGFTAETAVSATLSLFLVQDVIPALIGAAVLLKAKRK